MKIRVKFSKTGAMRFVGHLDFMRYFQKALRRAGIPLRYTEGYHPHPILSFALPLGIGLTSEGEYLDMEVLDTPSSAEALRAINAQMVEGVTVTEYLLLPETVRKAMASVAAADYIVTFRQCDDRIPSALLQGIPAYYEEREEIPVTKTGKKSERVIDLKPLLYQLSPFDSNRGLFIRSSAGSVENIRPELVLEDLYTYLGIPFDPGNFQIHRLELYENTDNGLRPLSEAGVPVFEKEVSESTNF